MLETIKKYVYGIEDFETVRETEHGEMIVNDFQIALYHDESLEVIADLLIEGDYTTEQVENELKSMYGKIEIVYNEATNCFYLLQDY